MKVCVVGLGYIGLPAASLLATKGFDVIGVDVKSDVVETINQGRIHIFEPDLDILVKSAVNSGRLVAATKPGPADVFIICVPTPFKENHEPDMRFVDDAVAEIAPHVVAGNVVILESTSPVGTTEGIARTLVERRPDLAQDGRLTSVYVAHCPERVLPGHILKELVDNDRIVGGVDAPSTERAAAFYKRFVNGQVLKTSARTAELAKLVENSYRDVNIAFANELSLVSDKLGVNVWELIELANRHPRVKILQPGPGVGGHCIAVDPWFIVHTAPAEAKLIRAAREINDAKPHHVVAKVKARAERFKDPVIACLGLAYKADIDDLRESPAVEIVRELSAAGVGQLRVVEPHVAELPRQLRKLENVQLVELDAALAHADIVLLLVNHRSFIELDRALLKERIVIDTRGIWR